MKCKKTLNQLQTASEAEKITHTLTDLNLYHPSTSRSRFVLSSGIVKKNIDAKKIFLESKCVGLKDGRANKVVSSICYLFISLYKNKQTNKKKAYWRLTHDVSFSIFSLRKQRTASIPDPTSATEIWSLLNQRCHTLLTDLSGVVQILEIYTQNVLLKDIFALWRL